MLEDALRRHDVHHDGTRAQSLLALSQSEKLKLRRRIERAGADLRFVEELDAIRLQRGRFKPGGGIDYDESARRYEEAFQRGGLGSYDVEPGEVARRVAAHGARLAAIAALDDWAACAAAEPRAWILEVARTVDPDPWRDRVRDQTRWADVANLVRLGDDVDVDRQPVTLLVAMATRWRRLGGDPTDYLLRVHRRYPNDFWVNFELGHLFSGKHLATSIGFGRAALALRPAASVVHFNLATALVAQGDREAGIHHYRGAIANDPRHQLAYLNLAVVLFNSGDVVGASEHFRALIELEPNEPLGHLGLRRSLLRMGRHREACDRWRDRLRAEPPEHEHWDGFAELCLFVGVERAYREACADLLVRFEDHRDPQVCERVARACLLRPGSDEVRERATALIDRALAADLPIGSQWARPYLWVTKGLAELRAGNLERAIEILEGEAGTVLQPAPSLLVAIARSRLGESDRARRRLADVASGYDWRPTTADVRERWIYAVLRREAEAQIISDFSALSSGARAPVDRVERLCLLGSLSEERRLAELAELYRDLIETDSN